MSSTSYTTGADEPTAQRAKSASKAMSRLRATNRSMPASTRRSATSRSAARASGIARRARESGITCPRSTNSPRSIRASLLREKAKGSTRKPA